MKIKMALAGPPKPPKPKEVKARRKAFDKQLVNVRTEINKLEELKQPVGYQFQKQYDAFMAAWDKLAEVAFDND